MDMKCNDMAGLETIKKGSKLKQDLFCYIMQFGMIACLIYLAYTVAYRPLVYGIDIVPYTYVKLGVAYLMYSLFNGLYKVSACKDFTSGSFKIKEEDGMCITFTSLSIIVINSVLAIKCLDNLFSYKLTYLNILVLVILLHMSLIILSKRYKKSCK